MLRSFFRSYVLGSSREEDIMVWKANKSGELLVKSPHFEFEGEICFHSQSMGLSDSYQTAFFHV